jgi:hypothetical protein
MNFVELGNAFEPRDYAVDLFHRVKSAMETGRVGADRFPTRASGLDGVPAVVGRGVPANQGSPSGHSESSV